LSFSNILGIAGVLTGVAGIVVGVVYSQASGKPVFKVIGNIVIRGSVGENISILYDNIPVPCVTRTRVAFWNAGRKTLHGGDIVKGYPIRFHLEGDDIRILDVTILSRSDEENAFSAITDEDNTVVQIDFDYLERHQGAVFEILHTARKWGVSVSGTLKGSPSGIREVGGGSPVSRKWIVPLTLAIVVLPMSLLVATAIILDQYNLGLAYQGILGLVGLTIMCTLFAAIEYQLRTPKRLPLSEK